MITINEALPNEYNIIQDIARKTWPVAYGAILSNIQMEYMLDMFYSIEALNKNADKGDHFLLAKENGIPLGFASYEPNYRSKPITRIHKIYILPEAQGKGIGKLLMEKMELLARKNHSQFLSLNVNRYNKAQLFYQKLGFEITAEEDIEIGNSYLMEDYIMEKIL